MRHPRRSYLDLAKIGAAALTLGGTGAGGTIFLSPDHDRLVESRRDIDNLKEWLREYKADVEKHLERLERR